MVLYTNKKDCCGCGICQAVCPTQAIRMQEQELGCLYPEIDPEKCVECGQCKKVCAYQTDRLSMVEDQTAWAVMAKQDSLLRQSASGGVFAAIATEVLRDGGMVVGCSMENISDSLCPVHICIDTVDQLSQLQGSKYVQSASSAVLSQIKQALKEGRTVLYSGTPCQVMSLRQALAAIDTTQLFTMDLICHGVPSATLLNGYIKTAHIKPQQLKTVTFRGKDDGRFRLQYIFKNGKRKTIPSNESSYYSLFLQAEIYRESCYHCRYACTDRVGDITIGDYWGVEQEHPEYMVARGGCLDEKKGISGVLINTEKGQQLVDRFGKDLYWEKSDISHMMKSNRQLAHPSTHSEKRIQILQAYQQSGYKGVERLFRKWLGLRYVVRKCKNRLRSYLHR